MAEQLFQIGVKGLIRNSSGEIFMAYVPEWNGNPPHWDIPGGRMYPGEQFVETLKREIKEEIGIDIATNPKQLITILTNLVIVEGQIKYPLVYVIYETKIPKSSEIKLNPDIQEKKYQWFPPKQAAKHMSIKFSREFCELVSKL